MDYNQILMWEKKNLLYILTSFASFRGIPSRNPTSFSTTSGCNPRIAYLNNTNLKRETTTKNKNINPYVSGKHDSFFQNLQDNPVDALEYLYTQAWNIRGSLQKQVLLSHQVSLVWSLLSATVKISRLYEWKTTWYVGAQKQVKYVRKFQKKRRKFNV